MIKRVYPSLPNKNYNAYNNVSICEQWLDFKVFEKWYKENYVEGYELDKDLLSDPENKMYSPETCCFMPRSLNCRTNINENVVKKNGKYGFMDIYNTKGKRFVPFNSISEAKRAKRMYHQIWVLSTLDVHKDKINKKIKTKIVSLYENSK